MNSECTHRSDTCQVVMLRENLKNNCTLGILWRSRKISEANNFAFKIYQFKMVNCHLFCRFAFF